MANAESAHFAFYMPVGLLTPAQWVAMAAQRYLHVSGATSEDLGRVAVADRRHAATNRRPGSTAAHHPGRAPGEPLHRRAPAPPRLLPGDRRGQAIVVTSLERARDLPNPPAVVAAAAQGSGEGQDMMTSYYRDDLCGLPEMSVVARQLWATSDSARRHAGGDPLRPLHPYVLYQLEELGFCARARPRTSSPTAGSSSAVRSPSTPTAASSARPTSTA